MRNRILGLIGVLWGGGVVLSGIMRGIPEGHNAYQAGQIGGLIFGALLFLVGLYYLIKGGQKKPNPK